tara:strand:- start:52 stop:159 length:108 start_codon:yes stop_codon:yes gene_type:complete
MVLLVVIVVVEEVLSWVMEVEPMIIMEVASVLEAE